MERHFRGHPYADGPVWAHSRFGLHDKGICPISNGQNGKRNLLRLSTVDGQAYEFRRE